MTSYQSIALIVGATGIFLLLCHFVGRVFRSRAQATEGLRDDHLTQIILGVLRLGGMGVATILVLEQLNVHLGVALAGAGGVGLVLALAARGIMENVLAGVVIYIKAPFKPKHHIEVCGVDGVVIKTTLLETRIRRGDGAVIKLPNKDINGSILVNNSLREHRPISKVVTISPGVEVKDMREYVSALKFQLRRQACFKDVSSDLLGYDESGYQVRFSAYHVPFGGQESYGMARWAFYQVIAEWDHNNSGLILGAPPQDVTLHNAQAG